VLLKHQCATVGEATGIRPLPQPNPRKKPGNPARLHETVASRLATEWLWFNYPQPKALHDYRYLGEDFRERERIKRKRRRWVRRLKIMPTLERYALLSAIQEARPPALSPDGAILQHRRK
jgi:hypothetical protein